MSSSTQSEKTEGQTETYLTNSVLESINWNFSTPFSVGRSGINLFDCRKHHWYPGTFIPEIPYTLIDVLSKPGDVVYDSFAGIGTTIFQALLLGRKPYGTELCHVTVNFMRSLWILLNPNVNIDKTASDIESIKRSYNPKENYSRMLEGTTIRVDLLRPWFAAKTFNEIMYLAWVEKRRRQMATKAAIRIALSATLKAVCAQNRGWGCIADNMLPTTAQIKVSKSMFDTFSRKVGFLLKDIIKVRAMLPTATKKLLSIVKPDSYILQGDVRSCTQILDESVDLIVTSPPYPNMTDYATSQRLSYYWLGEDPMGEIAFEIGARRKRFRPTSIKNYLDEMKSALSVIGKKLKHKGYACFVMPEFEGDKQNNTIRKQAVQECLAFLLSNGFVLEKELTRILPTLRRQHNQKWTSLEREHIYIYRKVK